MDLHGAPRNAGAMIHNLYQQADNVWGLNTADGVPDSSCYDGDDR